LRLRVVPSYGDDVERLGRHTEQTLRDLEDLSLIHVGSTTVKVTRVSTAALRVAAEKHSVLVIGQPGAGKSGAIHDLVGALRQGGRDVVFLAVDRLEVGSLGELRQVLGLEHD